MVNFEEIEFNHWKPVSEDFLYENFVNDPVLTKEEKKLIEIDPQKIHFVETPFDRYYYKEKFPLFDDEVCEILEKCSIEKIKKKNELPPIKEEDEVAKPTKKSAVKIEHKNFIVNFN